MGNLGAELILDPDCAIQSSLNVEFDAARAIMGLSLLEMHRNALASRWLFQPEFAQDHAFDQPADLITSLSALLYVPRNHLTPCLDRAWNSLNPGGFMVIYEHIKHPILFAFGTLFQESMSLLVLIWTVTCSSTLGVIRPSLIGMGHQAN